MREVKFRQPIFENGKFSRFHYWGFVRDGEFTGVVSPIEDARKNSQQFTGLLDRNGREIYEGDVIFDTDCFSCIITYGSIKDAFPEHRIVVFDIERSKFRLAHIHEEIRDMETYGYTLCKNNAASVFEIIGNIYEHPELLEDKP